jgi:hypothetical protein
MAYRVNKPIPKGDGTFIASGTLVDGKQWRNLRSLIAGRYLVEVLDAIPSAPAPAPAPVVEKVVEASAVEEEKPRSSRKARKRVDDAE